MMVDDGDALALIRDAGLAQLKSISLQFGFWHYHGTGVADSVTIRHQYGTGSVFCCMK